MTGIYALVHMAVDLSCAFLVYTYVLGGEQWYLWLLLYNFCAFALQMPIGAAADRLDRNSCVAVGGCAGVLAGLLLGIAGFPAGAAVVAGIGNACFHVGGGIDVLNHSERRAAPRREERSCGFHPAMRRFPSLCRQALCRQAGH